MQSGPLEPPGEVAQVVVARSRGDVPGEQPVDGPGRALVAGPDLLGQAHVRDEQEPAGPIPLDLGDGLGAAGDALGLAGVAALDLQGMGGDPRRVALPPERDRGRGGDDRDGEHQDRRQRVQGRQRRVTTAPAPGPFGRRGSPRQDRLARLESAEVLDQGGDGGVAPGRLLLEALQHDGLEVARQAGDQPRRRHRLGGLDQLEGLDNRRPLERRPSGQQLVEDRPERVGVRGAAYLARLPLGLLGGHVAGRAHDDAGPRQAAVDGQALGEAEVRDLGRLLPGQQDIGRLEVTVDDLQPVGLGHPQGQGSDQPRRPLRRPGRPVEAAVEAAAGHELQLDEREAIRLTDVEDLDDVGMLEPGDGLGLAEESPDRVRVGMRAGQDHLDGAGAIEQDIAGMIDDAHPSAAQLAQDLVPGDRRDGPPPSSLRGGHGGPIGRS